MENILIPFSQYGRDCGKGNRGVWDRGVSERKGKSDTSTKKSIGRAVIGLPGSSQVWSR